MRDTEFKPKVVYKSSESFSEVVNLQWLLHMTNFIIKKIASYLTSYMYEGMYISSNSYLSICTYKSNNQYFSAKWLFLKHVDGVSPF